MNNIQFQVASNPMMADTFSFAVVIPVFNGQATIAEAITSCLQQTILPEEIIVVDDGSSDQTASVVAGFRSELIRYLPNDKNNGPSFARNLGMRSATSSWILFLDADDIFHHRKLEVLLNCIQQNTSIRAIGHSFNINKRKTTPIEPSLPTGELEVKRLSVFNTLLRNPVVTPSLAVSTTNGIFFNEGLTYAEDHDFILRTTEKYGLWYLDLPLCSLGRIPLTAGGLSSRKWDMRKGEMRMYIDYCERHKYFLLIPILVIFSIIKHIWSFFR